MIMSRTGKERVINIQITVTNRNRLEKLKKHGDTFNHVVGRLLDFYEENKE